MMVRSSGREEDLRLANLDSLRCAASGFDLYIRDCPGNDRLGPHVHPQDHIIGRKSPKAGRVVGSAIDFVFWSDLLQSASALVHVKHLYNALHA